MIDYNKIRFQYFPAKVYDTTVLGTVSLADFIEAHRNPKPEILEVFKQIEIAAQKNDLKLKDSLKANNLYYFTVSVLLNGGRTYQHIEEFLPLMMFEFDKIDHAEELKQFLFERMDCCIAAYLSPSKRGLKLLIHTDTPTSIDDYKLLYCGMAYHLSKYEGFDGVNFNAVIPTFLSYDKNILVRPAEDVKAWTIRGGKINAFKPFVGEFEAIENISPEDREAVESMVTYCINRITSDGHNSVVSTAAALGGYIASSYIDFEDAQALIYDLIANNDYLSKGIKGYQKTATTMMLRGMSSPLKLKHHE